MSQIYSYDGIVPVIDSQAYVHPAAVIIGDVHIASGCYVGPCAVLRGDFGRIVLQTGCNVQETCVVHSFPNKDVVIEEAGHIGHGAVLHGCHISRNVLVGMNAVVMDGAMIGENSIVAAMAFVPAGLHIPPDSLCVGIPAKVIRTLTAEEMRWKQEGTAIYQRLAFEARDKLQPTQALTQAEPNRRRASVASYDPLSLARRSSEQP